MMRGLNKIMMVLLLPVLAACTPTPQPTKSERVGYDYKTVYAFAGNYIGEKTHYKSVSFEAAELPKEVRTKAGVIK
jgi:hypothetical protein